MLELPTQGVEPSPGFVVEASKDTKNRVGFRTHDRGRRTEGLPEGAGHQRGRQLLETAVGVSNAKERLGLGDYIVARGQHHRLWELHMEVNMELIDAIFKYVSSAHS